MRSSLLLLFSQSTCVQADIFCVNANSQTCGVELKDTTGETRTFDLSSWCLTTGGGYYAEDNTTGGHEYQANVCGGLASECQVNQYCQYSDIDPNTGQRTPEGCSNDPDATSEGMAKQFGFSEGCGTSSCSKCYVLASNVLKPQWGPLYIQGVQQPLSSGVSVAYNAVPSTAITANSTFGQCGGSQLGRSATYQFSCDCDVDTPSFKSVRQGPWDKDWTQGPFPEPGSIEANDYDCQYTLYFTGRGACYQGFCSHTTPPSPSSSSSLSGGSIFLIILTVAIAVYLGAACFVEHRRSGVVKLPTQHISAVSGRNIKHDSEALVS